MRTDLKHIAFLTLIFFGGNAHSQSRYFSNVDGALIKYNSQFVCNDKVDFLKRDVETQIQYQGSKNDTLIFSLYYDEIFDLTLGWGKKKERNSATMTIFKSEVFIEYDKDMVKILPVPPKFKFFEFDEAIGSKWKSTGSSILGHRNIVVTLLRKYYEPILGDSIHHFVLSGDGTSDQLYLKEFHISKSYGFIRMDHITGTPNCVLVHISPFLAKKRRSIKKYLLNKRD